MDSNTGVFKVLDMEQKVQEEEYQRSANVSMSQLRHPHRPANKWQFWGIFAFSQVIGALCIFLVIYWSTLYGRLSWNDNKQLFFFHPILMIIGLVFLYGDAILVYRVLHFLPKKVLKVMHAVLHLGAIACSSIGLFAVFENRKLMTEPDLYSLHSWVGLVTCGIFICQYIVGFLSFLFPGIPLAMRAVVMPFHIFFGISAFFMAITVSQMGLTQRLLWTDNYTKGVATSQAAIIGNALGLSLMVFGLLVAFLVTWPAYKRRPLPGEGSVTTPGSSFAAKSN